MLPLIVLGLFSAAVEQQVWMGVVVEPAVLDTVTCARVIVVVPKSPADRTLHIDDCIVRVDGVPVSDLDSLTAVHLRHKPGEKVAVELRGGKSVLLAYERLPSDARERTCRATESVIARVRSFVEGREAEQRLQLRPRALVSELRRMVAGAALMPFVIVDRRTGCDGSPVDPLLGAPDSTELVDGDQVFFLRTSKLPCARSVGLDGGLRCDQ